MLTRGALLLVVLMLASVAAAQPHAGTVRGVLVGADGSPAARMPFRFTDEATGRVRRGVSDDRGRFILAGLEPGAYRVQMENEDYREFAARIEVRGHEETGIELWLTLGSISASADFRPFFRDIARTSAALHTRFDRGLVSRLPLDGRHLADVVLLAPGITAGDFGPVAAGASPGSSGYLLDGFFGVEPLLGVPAVMPLPESLEEIDILATGYPASLGRTAGAQVSTITRSGTNRPTGGAYLFHQPRIERTQGGGFAGGPLVRDRAFFFGHYQHTAFSDHPPLQEDGHQLDARADHGGGAGRVTARYTVVDAPPFGRRGQHAGVGFTHAGGTAFTSDLRAGVTRVTFDADADASGFAESNAYQLAGGVAYGRGSHLVTAGADWFAFTHGVDSDGIAAHVIGAFVQDDWRATTALSLDVGLRLERFAPASWSPEVAADTTVLPRVGAVYAFGEGARNTIQGTFGRYANQGGLKRLAPRSHAWTIGVQRQMSRIRTLEITYIGSRGDDPFGRDGTSRYRAVRIQFEQGAETALSGHFAYTYGRWTTDAPLPGERVRAPLDSRHKATAAFTWSLPFGPDRRFFEDGWLGTVLGNLEMAGIAAVQSGRPLGTTQKPQQPFYQNVDLALLKTVDLPAGALQLRVEAYNLSNRDNPRDALFGAWSPERLLPGAGTRRYQLGARFLF